MLIEPQGGRLTITHCGRLFKVVAVADTDGDANRYMMENENAAVLVVLGNLVVMADRNDRGGWAV
ncbi:MAG: hypothetical protein LAT63_16660 [Marinobacter sp.]|nr:hypothetical protein [Marinobacter sp.]